ncbi:hypothetical protein TGVAND_439210, partial [Toxoplasma gondii VAND]
RLPTERLTRVFDCFSSSPRLGWLRCSALSVLSDKATMLGIAGAVSEYNKTPWGEVKPVEAIRLPLLGAGHFRGHRSLDSIGRANAAAVEAAITRFDPRVELQFMYEPSDVVLHGFLESERKFKSYQQD